MSIPSWKLNTRYVTNGEFGFWERPFVNWSITFYSIERGRKKVHPLDCMSGNWVDCEDKNENFYFFSSSNINTTENLTVEFCDPWLFSSDSKTCSLMCWWKSGQLLKLALHFWQLNFLDELAIIKNLFIELWKYYKFYYKKIIKYILN